MANISAKDKGSAGARYAAGILGNALGAEVSFASMDEEAAKIDLKISLRNALSADILLIVQCQVKSGRSYRAKSAKLGRKDADKELVLDIDAKTIRLLKSRPRPALLVWVPQKPSPNVYHHIFRENMNEKTKIRINKRETVSPALRYDLARAQLHNPSNNTPSVDIRKQGEPITIGKAKEFYRELKLIAPLKHPLVGEFKITRHGWKHVTRKSKSTRSRKLIMPLIPYLRNFLDKMPDRYETRVVDVSDISRMRREDRYVTCFYRNGVRIEGKHHTLAIRFKESVLFPQSWRLQPLYEGEVKRTVVLETWWLPTKKRA